MKFITLKIILKIIFFSKSFSYLIFKLLKKSHIYFDNLIKQSIIIQIIC